MDAPSLLRERYEMLLDRLDQVERAVVRLHDHDTSRAEQEFRRTILDRQRRLRADISSLPRDAVDVGAWRRLKTRERGCNLLFREALAYLGARLLDRSEMLVDWLDQVKESAVPPRKDEASRIAQAFREATRYRDAGLRGLADALTGELNEASRLGGQPFTLFDTEESFSDFVQIVRLRFPPSGIWDLPVTAHEYGHFFAAAYHLTAEGFEPAGEFKDCVNEILADKGDMQPAERKRWTYHLNEFFADAFAAYAMGPCYAMTSLLLRFGIADAHEESDSHPSYARRAAVILATLRRADTELRRDGQNRGFRKAIDLLAEQWADLVGPTEQAGADEANDIAGALFRLLKRVAPYALYGSWDFADAKLQDAIAPAERSGSGPRGVAAGVEPAAPGPYGVRDLLNAAWLVRLRNHPPAPADIGRRVVELRTAPVPNSREQRP